MSRCTCLNKYSSFKHISSQRIFYTKTWWWASHYHRVLCINTGLGHTSRFVGRCVKTRQINLSAIRKVKLKEHGLLKQKEKRGSHRENGRPSSRICLQGGMTFPQGGIYAVAEQTMFVTPPWAKICTRTHKHRIVCLNMLSDLSLEQQNTFLFFYYHFFILKTWIRGTWFWSWR